MRVQHGTEIFREHYTSQSRAGDYSWHTTEVTYTITASGTECIELTPNTPFWGHSTRNMVFIYTQNTVYDGSSTVTTGLASNLFAGSLYPQYLSVGANQKFNLHELTYCGQSLANFPTFTYSNSQTVSWYGESVTATVDVNIGGSTYIVECTSSHQGVIDYTVDFSYRTEGPVHALVEFDPKDTEGNSISCSCHIGAGVAIAEFTDPMDSSSDHNIYNITTAGLTAGDCYPYYRKVGTPVSETITIPFAVTQARIIVGRDGAAVGNSWVHTDSWAKPVVGRSLSYIQVALDQNELLETTTSIEPIGNTMYGGWHPVCRPAIDSHPEFKMNYVEVAKLQFNDQLILPYRGFAANRPGDTYTALSSGGIFNTTTTSQGLFAAGGNPMWNIRFQPYRYLAVDYNLIQPPASGFITLQLFQFVSGFSGQEFSKQFTANFDKSQQTGTLYFDLCQPELTSLTVSQHLTTTNAAQTVPNQLADGIGYVSTMHVITPAGASKIQLTNWRLAVKDSMSFNQIGWTYGSEGGPPDVITNTYGYVDGKDAFRVNGANNNTVSSYLAELTKQNNVQVVSTSLSIIPSGGVLANSTGVYCSASNYTNGFTWDGFTNTAGGYGFGSYGSVLYTYGNYSNWDTSGNLLSPTTTLNTPFSLYCTLSNSGTFSGYLGQSEDAPFDGSSVRVRCRMLFGQIATQSVYPSQAGQTATLSATGIPLGGIFTFSTGSNGWAKKGVKVFDGTYKPKLYYATKYPSEVKNLNLQGVREVFWIGRAPYAGELEKGPWIVHDWMGRYHRITSKTDSNAIIYKRSSFSVPLPTWEVKTTFSTGSLKPVDCRMAIDNRQRIEVVFTDGDNNKVYGCHSDDDGLTFSAPTMLIPSGSHPTIATDKLGTTLVAAFVSSNSKDPSAAGKIVGMIRYPGDTAYSSAFTFQSGGADMKVVNDTFHISRANDGPHRLLLATKLYGEDSVTDWQSGDDGHTWTKVITH